MKKKLIKKLFITLLINTIFLMFIVTTNVRAVSNEKLGSVLEEVSEGTEETEQLLVVEEKIMEYDVRTNTTREVDLQELTQKASKLRTKNADGSLSIESIKGTAQYMSKVFPIKSNYSVFSSSRDKISDTSILPYSAVCRITFSDPSSSSGKSLGSGALVGKNILLTSAHCVFDKNNNNVKFENWIAEPAYNIGRYNNLASGWSRVYYSNAWMSNHSYEYDWAICVLENSVGSTVGALGAQSYNTNSEMDNLNVRTFGYPVNGSPNNGGQLQYVTFGKIEKCYDNWFKYTGDISGGMSGGPIMLTDSNKIVGITCQKYLVQDAGRAWRMTTDAINLIAELRNS